MLRVHIQRSLRQWSSAKSSSPATSSSRILQPHSINHDNLLPVEKVNRRPVSTPLSPSSATNSTTTLKRRRRRQRPSSLAQHIPRLSHQSSILHSPSHSLNIQAALPLMFQSCDWQCVYSTMRDGISLNTLYTRCAGSDPIITLIRDASGSCFGCYNTTSWRSSSKYYGTGESFVFTLTPELRVFKWSRSNSYFQLSNSNSIAMGGGSHFAFFLDSMLHRGTSGACETFNSPCLSAKKEFEVVVLEAYKLVAPPKLIFEEDR